MIDAANALAVKSPGSALQIAAWVQPEIDHLAKLQSGQVWANGSWKAKGYLPPSPASADPAVRHSVGSSPSRVLRMPATAVPGTTMAVAIGVLGAFVLMVMLKVLSDIRRILPAGNAVVQNSKSARVQGYPNRKPLGILHILMTLSLLLCLSAGGYVAWRLCTERETLGAFRAKHGISDVPASDLLKSLLAGAKARESGHKVSLPVKDADVFMQTGLVLDSEETPMKEISLVRTGLAAAETPSGVILAEELRFFGSPILIEYSIPKASGGRKPAKMAITANGVQIPGGFASFFWNSLVDQISDAYKKSEFAKEYRVVSFHGDSLVFKP